MRPFATLTLAVGLATLSLASAPVALDPPGDILAFHAVAAAAIAQPIAAERLDVACTRKVRADETQVGAAGWWSLLAPRDAAGGRGAVIAAFTLNELRKPGDALSTTVRFQPMPTALVTRRSTLDWAWIWDRNSDGRADYVAYLQNAHAVLPDSVPADWPRPEVHADGHVYISRALLGKVLEHAAMVFRHYADDDHDGVVDAVVVEQFDPVFTMFVANFVVARRARGAGRAGEAWAFRRRITDTLRVVAADSTGTIRIPAVVARPEAPPLAGGRVAVQEGVESADERLAFGTRVLAEINGLAAHCGPVKGRIRIP